MSPFRLELTSLEQRELASVTAVAPLSVSRAVAAHWSTDARVASDVSRSTDVKQILATARAANDMPAMAGGIVAGGQTTVDAVGVRERGRSIAVTVNDEFHLGSNGKAMTATLAGLLVERGFLNWNTTLGQAFPELRSRMNPAFSSVTLDELLNHRSGISDDNVDPILFERVTEFRGNGYQARARFLPELLTMPAGTRGEFQYSNTGYTIAGAMMERATGNAYEYLMKKYIFAPLGMTSAGFGPPGSGYGRLDQPRGHDPLTGLSVGNGRDADAPAALSPAGLVHMSMADWSKFLRAHLGERVNGVRLLSDSLLTKLHTPDPRPTGFGEIAGGTVVGYGYGWITIQTSRGVALWHNGSNGYWNSAAIIYPQQKIAAFAVANQGQDTGVAVQTVLNALLNRVNT